MPNDPQSRSHADRLSLPTLMVVLVVTNAWFLSQALPYVH
jgi:hypothetical protein